VFIKAEGESDSKEIGECAFGATRQAWMLEFPRPPRIPLHFPPCAVPGVAPLPGVLLALGFEPAGHDSGGDPIGGRFLEIGPGLAIPSGDINATVLNYAALKFFKSSISTANVQPAMEAAREFILAAGGIDATNQFTKTFLALFGLRGWEDLSEIPYLIFLEVLPLNYRQFSQWVIPHLIPMACLRHNRVSPKIRGTFGPELDLGELYAGQSWQSHEKENEPSALGRPLGHQHALMAPPRPERGFCGPANRRNRLISA
jgi:hypothetical protein